MRNPKSSSCATKDSGTSIGSGEARALLNSLGKEPRVRAHPVQNVDSTQTVRALTMIELQEQDLSKWFAIELAVAEQPFRPEEVLNLDIFQEFSLYSTLIVSARRKLYALRLGFFTEQAAAEAVTSYVRHYFDGSCVRRVSFAEQDRFAQARVQPSKISEGTGIQEVIELSSPPPVPTTNLSDLAQFAESETNPGET